MSQLENASRSLIEEHQLARLQLGLTRILPHNLFYEEKLLANTASLTLQSLDDLSSFPFTSKQEFVADQVLLVMISSFWPLVLARLLVSGRPMREPNASVLSPFLVVAWIACSV